MDETFKEVNISVVANGYVLRRRPANEMSVYLIGSNEFVFETFESLVSFLQENLENPVKTLVKQSEPIRDQHGNIAYE